MAPRARAALSGSFRPLCLENNRFKVYLGNSSRPFRRCQSSCSKPTNQPTPLKKALIYANHMGRPSEVGKYGNAISHRVAGLSLVCLCTFMCFGGGVALQSDLQGGRDLAFKASLLLLASPKSPTLSLTYTT